MQRGLREFTLDPKPVEKDQSLESKIFGSC